ncbi:MAG: hypothetical protein A2W31_03870 [Planctomycetes bacterium RBG_16_64_10]|nr:MAG: hypothetical protein A2W31_03870 [Planctomycetes bacterium RBG_16_64_10]
MHRFHPLLIVTTMFAAYVPLAAQTPSPEKTTEDQVRQTVTTFWKALGELDANGLLNTLDKPNVLIETRPDGPTGPATVNTDMATFQAEVRRTAEGLGSRRKGDFYGTTVSTIEVRFLHATLAYAHHMCRLGGESGERSRARRAGRDFESIAVLRATGDATQPWKIVLITIPK